MSWEHYRYGIGQWDKVLQSNALSHWLSPYPEWSMMSSPSEYCVPSYASLYCCVTIAYIYSCRGSSCVRHTETKMKIRVHRGGFQFRYIIPGIMVTFSWFSGSKWWLVYWRIYMRHSDSMSWRDLCCNFIISRVGIRSWPVWFGQIAIQHRCVWFPNICVPFAYRFRTGKT